MLVWSESRTHDSPRLSPVHNQVSHRCAVIKVTKVFLYKLTQFKYEKAGGGGGVDSRGPEPKFLRNDGHLDIKF